MGKINRTPEEKENKYAQQLGFLKSSCISFDKGNYAEAIRISTSLVILLLNKGHNKSLLEQTGRSGIQFKNTCMHMPKAIPTKEIAIQAESLLARIDIGLGTYMPLYDDNNGNANLVSFEEWWDMNVLYSLDHRHTLSRGELITIMRNQDGGGHVDPQLEEKYAAFTIREEASMQLAKPGRVIDIDGPTNPEDWFNVSGRELSTMRQIAHEVLASLGQEIEIVDSRRYLMPFRISLQGTPV